MEGADVDLSGLVESIVDSDEEDLESDIGSLAGLRDSVRECLEKDPSERTEDDVEVLLDLMGHLPVSVSVFFVVDDVLMYHKRLLSWHRTAGVMENTRCHYPHHCQGDGGGGCGRKR